MRLDQDEVKNDHKPVGHASVILWLPNDSSNEASIIADGLEGSQNVMGAGNFRLFHKKSAIYRKSVIVRANM